MSLNFSKHPRLRRWLINVGLMAALPTWTLGSVFVVGGALAQIVLFVTLAQLQIDTSKVSTAVLLTALNLLMYVIGLGVLAIEPYAIRRLNWSAIKSLIGLGRRLVPKDFSSAILGWAGYFLMTAAVAVLIKLLMPDIDTTQVQEIGYSTRGPALDALIAFGMIVIAAPIVEEIVFRGYLFGSLRQFLPWWIGALVTSVLFGVVHGQWNVGIDVFVLSMVACYLRERTGAIWAGIGVHMLKNSLAYYILFLAPPWLLKMLGV